MVLLRRLLVAFPLLAGAVVSIAIVLTPSLTAGAGSPSQLTFRTLPTTTFVFVPPSFTIDPSLLTLPSIAPSTTEAPTTTSPPATTTSTTTTTATTAPLTQTDRLNRTGATIDGELDNVDGGVTADDGGLPVVVPIAAGVVLVAGAAATVLVLRSRRA